MGVDYTTFEWDLVNPFVCPCGGTPRLIRGFRYLSPADRLRVVDLVPAWLSARVVA